MNKYDVLKIILDEKKRVDKKVRTQNDLTQWFWKVGFRNIIIDEETKHITCEVSRPNQFILEFKKPIINFLIYLTEHVFINEGYTFELKKYTDDEYYEIFKNYLNINNNEVKH